MRWMGSALLLALLWSSRAGAEGVKDASRAAARDLGYSGVESYQSGDYQTAFSKLDKAYQVLQVPSLGLWSARALIKTGHWVEAAERLRGVLALDPKGGDAAVQQQAVRDARQELDGLRPRIPSLIIVLGAASGSEARVTVDDDAVAPALLGEAFPANPGPHTIIARIGDRVAKREVTLQERQQERVNLSFDPASAPKEPVAAPSLASQPPSVTGDAPSSLRKTIGWVLVGTGAAGVALGATTGILALGKRSSLKDSEACHGQECLRSEADQVDSFNSLRTISSIGLIAGGAVAVSGVVLLVTAPKTGAQQASAVWLKASPTSVALAGAF